MAVTVDWDSIDSVDDLDKQFKKALARAEEADEPAVRLEWAEAKGQFYERRAAKAELSVAKQAALDKYPLAKDFADEIRGASPAEVEASAKRFHERIEKLQGDQAASKQKAADDETAAKAAAQQAYGAPVAAGGGTPIPPAMEDMEAIKQRTWKKLGEGRGMQDSQSKLDFPRFASTRLREGVIASRTTPRYKDPGNEKKVVDDRRGS